MDRFDQLRTFVRVADGASISIVHAQASRHSAKVRMFADFAARLLRDWNQRIHARAGA